MSILQKICLVYVVVLLAAASLNYIPGLTDAEGLAFGIFALDIFDDALHVASALWALFAALWSKQSARFFLIVFGALYLGDGVFGFFTGYGYLDLGIFTNASAGLSFTFLRLAANVPHLLLGAVALWAGLKLDRA
ncbi:MULTISPECIES: hypothetical protein [unclassified Roseobacter]|uniref:hypothetical protein n=1 Tax=unclassified Roseobacter TaxID=196798 RepID=UPI0018A2731F|nr:MULTISPECIES: hypothetical protein [unclassified Roseobacter]MDW3180859.1 hypothetical protein [Roseobacter sp.]